MQLFITFLGTGGSWPSIERNVSSIAIKRGSEVMLFDCGEGTQRQLQRSNLSYMQISKIFITHFHGDHFLGLPGLLQTIQLNDREKPLYIYGPRGMKKIVASLLKLGYFIPTYDIMVGELSNGDELNFEGYKIKVLRTRHNVPSIAYCLEENERPGKFDKKKALSLGIPEGPLFGKLQKGKSVMIGEKMIAPKMVLGEPRPGRKITISGDTTPCKELIKFAKNSDVLIHDGTFDSTLEEKANRYGHSTAKQAAEIAKKAGVEKLFLVHISPRYKNGGILEREAREIFEKSFVAEDLMEIEIRLKK